MRSVLLIAAFMAVSCSSQKIMSKSETKGNAPKASNATSNPPPQENYGTNPMAPAMSPLPLPTPGFPGAIVTPDESATPPTQINGAFLACGVMLEASDEIPTAEIGCRLNDKDGKRVDPLALGVKAQYSISGLPADVKVIQRSPTTPVRDFDSIFDLSGATKQSVLDAIARIIFGVKFSGVLRGEDAGGQTTSLSQVSIPVKRGDWLSFLSNTSPTYMDVSTSLTWALDNGTGYTLAEGEDHCNGLIYANRTNWRLPTITELQTAHLNGLGVAYADAGNMNIDSARFGGYGASSLEFPGQPPVIGQSRRWGINLAEAAGENTSLHPVENRLSVICVSE